MNAAHMLGQTLGEKWLARAARCLLVVGVVAAVADARPASPPTDPTAVTGRWSAVTTSVRSDATPLLAVPPLPPLPLPSPTTTTSTTSTTTTSEQPPATTEPSPACDATGAARVVDVATRAALLEAVAGARPGDLIRLAPGEYTGSFLVRRSGSAEAPVRLCGPRSAVLRSGSVERAYVLRIEASYWEIRGVTVTLGQKGVQVAGGRFNVLADLDIGKIGDEAVHFGSGSTDNRIERSVIHDTGLRDHRFGEGVYVGTAIQNRCALGLCAGDASDRNAIVGNRFYATSAEAVDVKEGTSGGLIEGNSFDGSRTFAHAWVDVKGNGWVVRANHGTTSPRDGFLTETAQAGWGIKNVFVDNVAEVDGPGYGFNVTAHNVVSCRNIVRDAASGMSRLPCSDVDG